MILSGMEFAKTGGTKLTANVTCPWCSVPTTIELGPQHKTGEASIHCHKCSRYSTHKIADAWFDQHQKKWDESREIWKRIPADAYVTCRRGMQGAPFIYTVYLGKGDPQEYHARDGAEHVLIKEFGMTWEQANSALISAGLTPGQKIYFQRLTKISEALENRKITAESPLKTGTPVVVHGISATFLRYSHNDGFAIVAFPEVGDTEIPIVELEVMDVGDEPEEVGFDDFEIEDDMEMGEMGEVSEIEEAVEMLEEATDIIRDVALEEGMEEDFMGGEEIFDIDDDGGDDVEFEMEEEEEEAEEKEDEKIEEEKEKSAAAIKTALMPSSIQEKIRNLQSIINDPSTDPQTLSLAQRQLLDLKRKSGPGIQAEKIGVQVPGPGAFIPGFPFSYHLPGQGKPKRQVPVPGQSITPGREALCPEDRNKLWINMNGVSGCNQCGRRWDSKGNPVKFVQAGKEKAEKKAWWYKAPHEIHTQPDRKSLVPDVRHMHNESDLFPRENELYPKEFAFDKKPLEELDDAEEHAKKMANSYAQRRVHTHFAHSGDLKRALTANRDELSIEDFRNIIKFYENTGKIASDEAEDLAYWFIGNKPRLLSASDVRNAAMPLMFFCKNCNTARGVKKDMEGHEVHRAMPNGQVVRMLTCGHPTRIEDQPVDPSWLRKPQMRPANRIAWNDPCPECGKPKSDSNEKCPLGSGHGAMPHGAANYCNSCYEMGVYRELPCPEHGKKALVMSGECINCGKRANGSKLNEDGLCKNCARTKTAGGRDFPYCSHTCGRCGGDVSHYRENCMEPEVLQPKDDHQHPDCLPNQRMNQRELPFGRGGKTARDEGCEKCNDEGQCGGKGDCRCKCHTKTATITGGPGSYHVKSEEGKNLGGPYKSKEQAEKRLRQVEYFKHKGSRAREEGVIYPERPPATGKCHGCGKELRSIAPGHNPLIFCGRKCAEMYYGEDLTGSKHANAPSEKWNSQPSEKPDTVTDVHPQCEPSGEDKKKPNLSREYTALSVGDIKKTALLEKGIGIFQPAMYKGQQVLVIAIDNTGTNATVQDSDKKQFVVQVRDLSPSKKGPYTKKSR